MSKCNGGWRKEEADKGIKVSLSRKGVKKVYVKIKKGKYTCQYLAGRIHSFRSAKKIWKYMFEFDDQFRERFPERAAGESLCVYVYLGNFAYAEYLPEWDEYPELTYEGTEVAVRNLRARMSQCLLLEEKE